MIGFSWNCWRSRKNQRGKGCGKALMAQAENIARANGCIGLWLDTYEFQARGFYEKLGFEVFGTLDDHPIGQKRFFLRKRLSKGPIPVS
jgi:ribosomal protein S18 acetylase RimI-like enzyme